LSFLQIVVIINLQVIWHDTIIKENSDNYSLLFKGYQVMFCSAGIFFWA